MALDEEPESPHFDGHVLEKGTESGNGRKWLVLALGSFALFSTYYAVDVPSAVHDRLKIYFEDSSQMDFNLFFGLMYSLYSVPNIVLPFFGGYLVSRYGAARMNVIFASTLVVGQLIVVFGSLSKIMMIVLMGRAIFGIGSESLCVGISALLADWFAGSHVALAMGLSLSISRLGSVVNDVLSTPLAESVSITFAFLFAEILLGGGLLAALGCLSLERDRAAKRVSTKPEDEIVLEHASWRSIFHFPPMFYWICLSCVTVYGVVIPWNSISSAFLIERYCGGECCKDGTIDCSAHVEAERSASALMTIPYAISGATVPFLGFLIDRFGGRALLTLLSALCLTIVHGLFAWNSSISPVPMLVFQGLSYAVYAAALWPSVPLIIPDGEVGLAYGFLTSVQNFGLSVIPLGVSALQIGTTSYQNVEVLFFSLALLGVTAGLALNWLDTFSAGHILNKTTTKAPRTEEADKILTGINEREIEETAESAKALVDTYYHQPISLDGADESESLIDKS